MLYIILAAVFVAVDQYTKFIARGALADGNVISFIPNTMDFVYVENRGAAFGMMQDTRWVLVALTLLVLGAVLFYAAKTKKRHSVFLLSVSLIVAGGIGNLIDRVFIGYVTDFLHFLFIDFPCFNIADVCVCIGGALIAVYLLFMDTQAESKGDKNER